MRVACRHGAAVAAHSAEKAGFAIDLAMDRSYRPRLLPTAGAENLLGDGARLQVAAIDQVRLGLAVDDGFVDDDLAHVFE